VIAEIGRRARSPADAGSRQRLRKKAEAILMRIIIMVIAK
jgi:hypothetical protein